MPLMLLLIVLLPFTFDAFAVYCIAQVYSWPAAVTAYALYGAMRWGIQSGAKS